MTVCEPPLAGFVYPRQLELCPHCDTGTVRVEVEPDPAYAGEDWAWKRRPYQPRAVAGKSSQA